MILKNNIDVFSFMPSGAVHIKPDLISPQSPVKLPQIQKKPFSIPLGMPDQPRFSRKQRDPTKDIQPRPMPACGWNPKPPAAFAPTHTQLYSLSNLDKILKLFYYALLIRRTASRSCK
jgi:hypothetical protein